MQNNSRWFIIRITVGTVLPWCPQGLFPGLSCIPRPKSMDAQVLYIKCIVSTCFRFSCVQLSVTPWPVAQQAPLSIGLFRQESWNGLPCPPPGDLPNPEIKPVCLLCLLPWAPSFCFMNTSSLSGSSTNFHIHQWILPVTVRTLLPLQCSNSDFLFPPLSLIKTS